MRIAIAPSGATRDGAITIDRLRTAAFTGVAGGSSNDCALNTNACGIALGFTKGISN